MALVRKKLIVAAIVGGSILTIAGIASTAAAIWVVIRPPGSGLPFETYYVLPSAWSTLFLFAVGVVGDMAFRRQVALFNGRGAWIWRVHFLFTTVLVAACFVERMQVEMTRQVVTIVYATNPLLLAAHGLALIAGAVVRIK